MNYYLHIHQLKWTDEANYTCKQGVGLNSVDTATESLEIKVVLPSHLPTINKTSETSDTYTLQTTTKCIYPTTDVSQTLFIRKGDNTTEKYSPKNATKSVNDSECDYKTGKVTYTFTIKKPTLNTIGVYFFVIIDQNGRLWNSSDTLDTFEIDDYQHTVLPTSITRSTVLPETRSSNKTTETIIIASIIGGITGICVIFLIVYIIRKNKCLDKDDNMYENIRVSSGTHTNISNESNSSYSHEQYSIEQGKVHSDDKIRKSQQHIASVNQSGDNMYQTILSASRTNHNDKQRTFQSEDTTRKVICVKENEVVQTETINTETSIAANTHENYNAILLPHTTHEGKTKIAKLSIEKFDMNVVILAVLVFQYLGIEELWIEFSRGKNLQYLQVHLLVKHIGDIITKAFLSFHAFTGYNRVTASTVKGKRTTRNTPAFILEELRCFGIRSSLAREKDINIFIPVVERLVLLYDISSNSETNSETRIPPISAALFHHTMHTLYKIRYDWDQALKPSPSLLSPADFGKTKESLKWGCKYEKKRRGKCKCAKSKASYSRVIDLKNLY